MRRVSVLLALVALGAAAPAHAGDPTLSLTEVQPGMRCTALSVIRGTDISSFDVEVLSVIGSAGQGGGPRILVRVSGPAVEPTGIGPGFSGSPIYCPGADGVSRSIGAISESIGQYGNTVALATPIESVLGQSPDPPVGAGRLPAKARASVRPLSGPLTFSGLDRRVARVYATAVATKGIAVLQSPRARPPWHFRFSRSSPAPPCLPASPRGT